MRDGWPRETEDRREEYRVSKGRYCEPQEGSSNTTNLFLQKLKTKLKEQKIKRKKKERGTKERKEES